MPDNTESMYREGGGGGGGGGLGLLDKLKSVLGFSAGVWPRVHIGVGRVVVN